MILENTTEQLRALWKASDKRLAVVETIEAVNAELDLQRIVSTELIARGEDLD